MDRQDKRKNTEGKNKDLKEEKVKEEDQSESESKMFSLPSKFTPIRNFLSSRDFSSYSEEEAS